MNVLDIGNKQISSSMFSRNLSQNQQQTKTGGIFQSRTDIYTSNWKQISKAQSETPHKDLTNDMAKELAKKYDLTNITRDEYHQMLKELRDSEIISKSEYTIAAGGLVPANPEANTGCCYTEPPFGTHATWPSNNQRTNCMSIVQSYGKYCDSYANYFAKQSKDVTASIGKNFSNTYMHLEEILQKIFDAAKDE